MSNELDELRTALFDTDEDEVYSALIKIGKNFYRELQFHTRPK
jgi:hypothetical protein